MYGFIWKFVYDSPWQFLSSKMKIDRDGPASVVQWYGVATRLRPPGGRQVEDDRLARR